MPGSVTCSYITHSQWQPLSRDKMVPAQMIYIWHGVTAELLKYYDNCYAILTVAERATAARFYHPENQKRYIIQHGILRLLLSSYTGIAPKNISFRYNENKKPYLQNTPVNPCFFNLSHSADDFLIAIGPEELGVDIEQINPKKHWEDIAADYFNTREIAYINSAPHPDKAFFLCWTRKEAFLKATGTGIDDNLTEISAMDGKQPIPADYPVVDWLTESFAIGDNFMGAVTYAGPKKDNQLLRADTDFVTDLLNNQI